MDGDIDLGAAMIFLFKVRGLAQRPAILKM